jgi:hypothetical protein
LGPLPLAQRVAVQALDRGLDLLGGQVRTVGDAGADVPDPLGVQRRMRAASGGGQLYLVAAGRLVLISGWS